MATGRLVSPAVATNLLSCQLILEFYSHQLCFYKPILFITWTKSFPCPVSQELQQPSSSPTINRDLFPAPSLFLISNQPCFSSQILKGQTYDWTHIFCAPKNFYCLRVQYLDVSAGIESVAQPCLPGALAHWATTVTPRLNSWYMYLCYESRLRGQSHQLLWFYFRAYKINQYF